MYQFVRLKFYQIALTRSIMEFCSKKEENVERLLECYTPDTSRNDSAASV